MAKKTPVFEDLIASSQLEAEPTEKETDLCNDLVAEGGFSEDNRFAPLVDRLLAWTFQTDSTTYYIVRDGSVPIWTVLLRVPVLSHAIQEDLKERARLEEFKRIIGKYIAHKTLNQTRIEETKYFFSVFMVFPFTISVPQFLKEELIGDLKRAEAEYYEISPDFAVTQCPICDKKLRVDATLDIIHCPTCGNRFTL